MSYQIITDSACDLPRDMLEQLEVTTAALSVHFRGGCQPDGVEDRQVKELYDAMRAGETASTAAVNPQRWREAIQPVLDRGEDALVLAFSSALSTTYQSAVIAAGELREEYPQRTVTVVDTRAAALGQGLLVWHTCQKRREGLSLEALAAWVEKTRDHVCHWFTVDDLMYLKRGGRVSAATAVLGTVLNIKPVLHVDNGGYLISMVKARGRKAAIRTLADKLRELGGEWDNSTVFICHADCPEDAKRLEELARQARPGIQRVFIGNLGAVIGSHAGPGTLALFFLGDQK